MKKLKILTMVTVAALAVVLAAMTLVGCGQPAAQDWVFEAENAILADAEEQTENTIKIQERVEAGQDETEPTKIVGYFATEGQTITWKINSSHACTATLKLRLSGCLFGAIDKDGNIADLNQLAGVLMGWGQAPEGFDMDSANGYLHELKAEDCGLNLLVNGTDATMSGTLAAAKIETGSGWALMGTYSAVSFGEYTAEINLKKGENTIVLEVVSSGANVDKITINAASKLTHTDVDNSNRIEEQQQQG